MRKCVPSSNTKESYDNRSQNLNDKKSGVGKSSALSKNSQMSEAARNKDITELAKKIGVSEILEEIIQRAQEQ